VLFIGAIIVYKLMVRSTRIEVMCSWRIFLTFFGLYMSIKLLVEFQGGVAVAVLKLVVVAFVLYFYGRTWRRSYANPGGVNKREEYSAPNQRSQADA
jgi:membrane protein implicated in regulation of membrane protease activity